jgi:beta-lactamase regulating signal transducer with metallopeptidase domain
MVDRLDTEEIAAVIAHELEHARRHDPTKALAIKVASRALFYFPLVHYLGEKALVAAELGADASAVSTVGRPALVGALLNVLGEVRPALGTATEMASLQALDVRIETLQTMTLPKVRPPLVIVIASLATVAAMWGLFVWLPPPPTGTVVHQVLRPIESSPRFA